MIPVYVTEWLDKVLENDKNPDVIADVFSALSNASLTKQFLDGQNDKSEKFRVRVLYGTMGKIVSGVSIKDVEAPMEYVVEWYLANKGNEGYLIAKYLMERLDAE